jgi:capsid protein
MGKPIKASYDAGGYDQDNANHWSFANGASADASGSPLVRQNIRNRARYEVLENNSYGRGILETLSQDTIGTGPRLQLHLPEPQAAGIEREWGYWSQACRLSDKLRTMVTAKTVDGEAIAKIVTNPPIPADVKLDIQLVEADRLTAPGGVWDTPDYIDGIHLDEYGNPRAYDILRVHPGSPDATNLLQFNTFRRDQVIHFYRQDRPEQHRGISEVVTALPLFAFMRRFTLATVAAAETAANHAMVLQTDAPASAVDEELAWETVELRRNAATVLPNEYKLGQVSAEHPATTYQMFKREILNEVSRCVCMPYNVAAADSSGYNYASGRLDHQVYDRALRVNQSRIEQHVLDRLLGDWLLESALLGMLPAAMASDVLDAAARFGTGGVAMRIPHSWEWDKRPHVDPGKEATAQRTRLQSGTTSRAHEMKESGLNMDEIDAQAAASFGYVGEDGLPDVESYRKVLGASLFSNGNAVVAEEQDTEETEADNDGQSETEQTEPTDDQV